MAADVMVRWINEKDGLVHLGPDAFDEDDFSFTLCSEDGRLLATWWMVKAESPNTVPTCLRCIGYIEQGGNGEPGILLWEAKK